MARLRHLMGLFRRSPCLAAGAALTLLLVIFCVAGPVFVDVGRSRPLSAPPDLAPSCEHPFGTDDHGRDLLAAMVLGTGITLRTGLLAGAVGLVIGTMLGVAGGYLGGRADAVIRGAADTLLTVPGLVVLVTIASSIRESIDPWTMALVVAALAWMRPARAVRAQVLSMRERTYVQMARLSGMGELEIMLREILPNLLPYLAASFVAAVASAVLAALGLEALGLGPQNVPTLGTTLYLALLLNAVIRGMWWWWGIPIALLVIFFVGLFLVSAGLDDALNPRLRRSP